MTIEEAMIRIKNHNEIHSRKELFYAIHITETLYGKIYWKWTWKEWGITVKFNERGEYNWI